MKLSDTVVLHCKCIYKTTDSSKKILNQLGINKEHEIN